MDRETIGEWYGKITSEAFQDALTPGSVLVIDAMEDGSRGASALPIFSPGKNTAWSVW